MNKPDLVAYEGGTGDEQVNKCAALNLGENATTGSNLSTDLITIGASSSADTNAASSGPGAQNFSISTPL